MKKIKYILVLIIVVIFSVNLNAQNYSRDIVYSHGIGVAAGLSTGFGLSYRYLPDRFGTQFTIGSSYEDFSFGITPIFVLRRSSLANLFLYSGNSFYKSYGEDVLLVNSFGFGIELNSETPFSISLMGGIGSFLHINDDWNYSYTVEATLYYRLNYKDAFNKFD